MPPFDPTEACARRRTKALAPLETRDGPPEEDDEAFAKRDAAAPPGEPSRVTLFVRLTSRATGMRWLTRLTEDAAAGAVPRARDLERPSASPSVPGLAPPGRVHVQLALSTEVACAFGVRGDADLPFTVHGANAAIVLTADDPGALKSLVVRHILFVSTHGGSVAEVHGEGDGETSAGLESRGHASGRRSREGLSKSDSPAASGVRAALLRSASQASASPKATRAMDPLPWVIVHDTWLAPHQGRWVRSAAPG